MSRVTVVETNIVFKSALKLRLSTRYFVNHHIGRIPSGLTLAQIDAPMVNEWHLGRGWSGIGYHYLIRPSGEIQRGRPNWSMGAHDEGENACTLGICTVGDFSLPESRPTDPQMKSLINLQADLCEKYGLRPTDKWIIRGHRDDEPDDTPTECPGDGLYYLLPEIRIKVQSACGF